MARVGIVGMALARSGLTKLTNCCETGKWSMHKSFK
jgi:hypothetical protein